MFNVKGAKFKGDMVVGSFISLPEWWWEQIRWWRFRGVQMGVELCTEWNGMDLVQPDEIRLES